MFGFMAVERWRNRDEVFIRSDDAVAFAPLRPEPGRLWMHQFPKCPSMPRSELLVIICLRLENQTVAAIAATTGSVPANG